MKTLLYTGYDSAYARLADITLPRMEQYAAKHGIDFRYYVAPLINVPHGIYWTGVVGALNAFRDGYDRAFYLDVDQLITNMDDEPMVSGAGFHAPKDWGKDSVDPWQFSMCGFIATPDAKSLFDTALEMEPEWRDKPFPEQGPMQHIVKKMVEDLPHMVANKENLTGLINVWPRAWLNCVPDEVCPGSVPEPWLPGDFAAHLTMLPLDERIKLAHKLIKEHGL